MRTEVQNTLQTDDVQMPSAPFSRKTRASHAFVIKKHVCERGRPDNLFSAPHVKNGQNGKLTGALWSQDDLEENKFFFSIFCISRSLGFRDPPSLSGGRGEASLKPSDFKMGKNEEKKKRFLLNRPGIAALRLVFHSDHFWCVVYAIPIPGHPIPGVSTKESRVLYRTRYCDWKYNRYKANPWRMHEQLLVVLVVGFSGVGRFIFFRWFWEYSELQIDAWRPGGSRQLLCWGRCSTTCKLYELGQRRCWGRRCLATPPLNFTYLDVIFLQCLSCTNTRTESLPPFLFFSLVGEIYDRYNDPKNTKVTHNLCKKKRGRLSVRFAHALQIRG